MKKTFQENVFICDDFSLTVKKTSCVENIGFWGLYGTKNAPHNFRDRTKWMVPLDLPRLRV